MSTEGQPCECDAARDRADEQRVRYKEALRFIIDHADQAFAGGFQQRLPARVCDLMSALRTISTAAREALK